MQRLATLFLESREKVFKLLDHIHPATAEVLAIRKRLAEKLLDSRPRGFIDFMSEEFIKEPVISDSGDVYERSTLDAWLKNHDTLPLTNLHYRYGELISSPELMKILAAYEKAEASLLNEISRVNAKSEKAMDKKIAHFIEVEIQNYERMFDIAKNDEIQNGIKAIKKRLYLDINNPVHLRYWNETGMFKFGLMSLSAHSGYRFSSQVYAVLKAANHEYKRVGDFRTAISDAQLQTRAQCCKEFWYTQKAKQIMRKRFLETDIASLQSSIDHNEHKVSSTFR